MFGRWSFVFFGRCLADGVLFCLEFTKVLFSSFLCGNSVWFVLFRFFSGFACQCTGFAKFPEMFGIPWGVMFLFFGGCSKVFGVRFYTCLGCFYLF